MLKLGAGKQLAARWPSIFVKLEEGGAGATGTLAVGEEGEARA